MSKGIYTHIQTDEASTSKREDRRKDRTKGTVHREEGKMGRKGRIKMCTFWVTFFVPGWGGRCTGVHYTTNNKLKKLKKAQHGLIMRMCHESRVRMYSILNFDNENKKCPHQAGTGLFMGWESCPRALKSDSPAATAELGVKTDDRKGTTAPQSSVPCRRQAALSKSHISHPQLPPSLGQREH